MKAFNPLAGSKQKSRCVEVKIVHPVYYEHLNLLGKHCALNKSAVNLSSTWKADLIKYQRVRQKQAGRRNIRPRRMTSFFWRGVYTERALLDQSPQVLFFIHLSADIQISQCLVKGSCFRGFGFLNDPCFSPVIENSVKLLLS